MHLGLERRDVIERAALMTTTAALAGSLRTEDPHTGQKRRNTAAPLSP